MSKRYEPQDIEKKWQKIWQDEKAFAATDDYTKPKYYALVEFPYPSGQGLHVGHPRPYTALDIVARKRRMQGYNVLYPMGCIWSSNGELCDQKPHSSEDRYQKQRTSLQRPASVSWIFLRLGQRDQHDGSGILSLDPVDFPETFQSRTGI